VLRDVQFVRHLADRAKRISGFAGAGAAIRVVGRRAGARVGWVDAATLAGMPFTASRSIWLGRKTSTRRGMIGTSTPVFGLRPTRRPFCRTENVPKPLILTDLPTVNASAIRLNIDSRRSADSFRDSPTVA
jgi:hypothetical protein